MKRVARKAAGKQVYRLADEHMAKAYAIEEQAHAEIHDLMAREVPEIERAVKAAVRDGGPLALAEDRKVQERLVKVVARVVRRSEAPVRVCLFQTGLLAAETTRKELLWVERTLAKRYEGMAVDATVGAELDVLWLVARRMEEYAQSEAAATSRFLTAIGRQGMLAHEAGDDLDMLLLRVTSPEPVRAAGISGKGVWWRLSGTLGPAMTYGSVEMSNVVFRWFMEAMNERYEARRG